MLAGLPDSGDFRAGYAADDVQYGGRRGSAACQAVASYGSGACEAVWGRPKTNGTDDARWILMMNGTSSKDDALEEKAGAGTERAVVPDLAETLLKDGGRIDVNVLLVEISQKATDPNAFLEEAERLLAIAEKFEAHSQNNFKARADAIIDVKHRDPDEIEKRSDNRLRRRLAVVVAVCAISCIGGGIANVAFDNAALIAGMLLTVGTLCVAMLGPLASGEAISSNDIIRLAGAVRGAIPDVIREYRTSKGK